MSQAAESVRDGDLSARVDDQTADEFAPLVDAMKSMQKNLFDIVSSVRSSSDAVASASVQIAQGNSDLSSRTEQQAAALEETSASM